VANVTETILPEFHTTFHSFQSVFIENCTLMCTTPIQWIPGALSLGIKRPGREADDLASSGAEVKNA